MDEALDGELLDGGKVVFVLRAASWSWTGTTTPTASWSGSKVPRLRFALSLEVKPGPYRFLV